MKTVLAAIDFSNATPLVLAMAECQARALGAQILLIHVEMPDPDFVTMKAGPPSVRKNVSREIRRDHRSLERAAAGLRKKKIRVKALLIKGPTSRKIAEEARRSRAELIVMGTHGYGLLRGILVGSVSAGVIRRAPCPVLLVRHPSAS